MCQPKPGPRCSSDMHKSVTAKNAALEASKANLDQATKELHQLKASTPLDHKRILQVEADIATYAKEDELKEKIYREEVYNYYATPSGKLHLTSESVEKAETTAFRIAGAFDDSGEWQQKQLTLPGNFMENIINRNAENHRNWQSETLKAIESKSLREKRDLIESEIQKHKQERVAISEAYATHQANEQKLLEIPRHAETPEDVTALRETYKNMRDYEIRNMYNEIQLKDLKSLSY